VAGPASKGLRWVRQHQLAGLGQWLWDCSVPVAPGVTPIWVPGVSLKAQDCPKFQTLCEICPENRKHFHNIKPDLGHRVNAAAHRGTLGSWAAKPPVSQSLRATARLDPLTATVSRGQNERERKTERKE
jgi:hypothetical protein